MDTDMNNAVYTLPVERRSSEPETSCSNLAHLCTALPSEFPVLGTTVTTTTEPADGDDPDCVSV